MPAAPVVLVVLRGELLVIVEGLLCNVWKTVMVNWLGLVNIEVVPETVSKKSGALLAIYRYSLKAAFGVVL